MARSRSQRKSGIAKNSRSRGNDENWITYHKTEAIKWRKIKTAIKKIPFRLEQFIYIYFALFERMRAWSVCICWCIFLSFCKCLSSSLFSYATAICGDYNICMLFISHKKKRAHGSYCPSCEMEWFFFLHIYLCSFAIFEMWPSHSSSQQIVFNRNGQNKRNIVTTAAFCFILWDNLSQITATATKTKTVKHNKWKKNHLPKIITDCWRTWNLVHSNDEKKTLFSHLISR